MKGRIVSVCLLDHTQGQIDVFEAYASMFVCIVITVK